MRRILLGYPKAACPLCQQSFRPALHFPKPVAPLPRTDISNLLTRTRPQHGQKLPLITSRRNLATGAEIAAAQVEPRGEDRSRSLPSLDKLSSEVERSRDRVLSTGAIPPADLTLSALRTCQSAAISLKSHTRKTANRQEAQSTSTSSLLALDPTHVTARTAVRITNHTQEIASRISEAAYQIILCPKVTLTPDILEAYVDIQATLGRPETLPEVLDLYASKSLPKATGSGIRYHKQNPRRAAAAVKIPVAEKALATAISAKNLDAAIGVIEACYTTSAFIRHKLLRSGLMPAAALVGTPAAIYLIAQNFAHVHRSMDPGLATGISFAAVLAYVGFTASMAVLARMSGMDQMVRVTWLPGTPMRQRWAREEERAALDKVACAWGFHETWRHGEEQGLEWDSLREYIGQKGMILDRVEFMEGLNG